MRRYIKLAIIFVFMLLAFTVYTITPGGVAVNAVSNNGVVDTDLLNVMRQVRKSYAVPAMAAAPIFLTDMNLRKVKCNS